jgi:hypothetical protein
MLFNPPALKRPVFGPGHGLSAHVAPGLFVLLELAYDGGACCGGAAGAPGFAAAGGMHLLA